MADNSNFILSTFLLMNQQKAAYAEVSKAFGKHFNSRQEQQGESAENYQRCA